MSKLPDFIIIGAQKCGTTFLRKVLAAHPDVYMATNELMPTTGEMQYYNRYYKDYSLEWYKSHFPDNGKLCGEKTPEYIFRNFTHKRIAKTLPKAKFIVALRNPIDRAFSAWRHTVRYSEESIENKTADDFDEFLHAHRDSVVRGFYAEQLKSFYSYISHERVKIFISERIRHNPVDAATESYKFLNLPEFTQKDPIRTGNIYPKEYKPLMKQSTKEYLQEIYTKPNKELFDLLGYEIPEWKN